ncbi:MAG TPA: hypothetical protein VMG98_15010 [Verrucomicrobiae bacterium]|nr:hypothetical protein [Verrucomicrobiae bacterium]
MDHLVLAAAISTAGAARIEIDHVPNNVSYRAALSPRDVGERARIRVESRDPHTVAYIVAAIERTNTSSDVRPADLRYAIRLRDARGSTCLVIYLDAFGRRGMIEGRPVRFSGDGIKRAIVATFPTLAQ